MRSRSNPPIAIATRSCGDAFGGARSDSIMRHSQAAICAVSLDPPSDLSDDILVASSLCWAGARGCWIGLRTSSSNLIVWCWCHTGWTGFFFNHHGCTLDDSLTGLHRHPSVDATTRAPCVMFRMHRITPPVERLSVKLAEVRACSDKRRMVMFKE